MHLFHEDTELGIVYKERLAKDGGRNATKVRGQRLGEVR